MSLKFCCFTRFLVQNFEHMLLQLWTDKHESVNVEEETDCSISEAACSK